MGSIDEWERRQADVFYADLVGMRRPRRRHRAVASTGRAPGAVPVHESITAGIDAGRLFDNVVHRGTDPTVLLPSEAEEEGGSWETVALPCSMTSPRDLPCGALIVGRALGEGRLAWMRVLGHDIQAPQLYGSDGRIRGDILVLVHRGAPRPPARRSAESVESSEVVATAERIESDEVVHTTDAAPPVDGVAAETAGPVDPGEPPGTMERVESARTSDAMASYDSVDVEEAGPPRPVSAVAIEAAPGLGTERTVAPIANVSPQRQINEILDRELILFARARILAEWIDQNFSATFDQARADSTLMARLDVSKDKALLERLRPFPQGRIPAERGQLFTSEAALQELLLPPTDAAGLWPIFDMLHFYGVVLLPPNPKDASGRPSVLARITRVGARLERARFDAESVAIERRAVQFKRDVANKGILHHAVEADVIPADWAAGTAKTALQFAKPVVALLRRLRERNRMWRAGTYAGHFWNDFSIDVFIVAGVNAEGFWARDAMRDFFRAMNAACEQDVPPGRFAWRAIYNDVGLATEIDKLYGAGRVLHGIPGHGPGADMHIHLDVRPLVVPLDATTGFSLQASRVVLSPGLPRPGAERTAPPPRTAPPSAPASEAGTWPAGAASTGAALESSGAAEAVPLGGRGRFRHATLGGDSDNVEARWNVDAATAAGSTVDIVVHLHGYGAPGADFLARKAAAAGLDMLDDAAAVRVRASRPTLALVPRGRHAGGVRWFFDTLPDRAAFDALVDAGLAWLATSILRLPAGSTLGRGRVTLMAHSGGGAGMSALLANGLDPDEVVCFDSTYGGEDPIRRWAEAKIASPAAARSGLRAFYRPCSGPLRGYPAGRWVRQPTGSYTYEEPGSWTWRDGQWRLITTEVSARRLQHAIERALARVTGGAALANRFRVERTSIDHGDIPARYSPLLLEDIAAGMPNSSAAPPSTTRPACVANDDWLTRPARKPGGNDPKPPRPGAATEDAPSTAVQA